MKSLLAIIGGLFVLGSYAQAGDSCSSCTKSPASFCQPVAAHVVHCHTTSCCTPCVSPCGSCGYAVPCATPYAYAVNGPYCRPLVRVVVRRRCLPRTIVYRNCYTACGW